MAGSALALFGGCLRMETPPYYQFGEGCEDTSECQPPLVCQETCRYDSGAGGGISGGTGGTSPGPCSGSCGSYSCDQTLGRCRWTCVTDDHCAAGYVCREGDCFLDTCDTSTAALMCRGAACSAGICQSHANCGFYGCAPDYQCLTNRCARTCLTDSECVAYRCDASTGECRTSCSYSLDCQAGYACADGFCQVD